MPETAMLSSAPPLVRVARLNAFIFEVGLTAHVRIAWDVSSQELVCLRPNGSEITRFAASVRDTVITQHFLFMLKVVRNFGEPC